MLFLFNNKIGELYEINNQIYFKYDKKFLTKKELVSPEKHFLHFKFEKRKGKPVTLVGRFYMSDKEKKSILKLLKTKLACGGVVKEDWIELQGDVKEKIKTILLNDGWKFK